jgi:protein-S-isoprenylcysteine O-methyltransferase Ste14
MPFSTVLLLLLGIVVVPLLPLLITRRWDWWEAWLFAGLNILGFMVSRLLAARRHPDLLAERARFGRCENPEPWDRILGPLVGLGAGAIPLVAGIDGLGDGSASFSLAAKGVSLAVILGGFCLASYALIENRFFSGMVRLQVDRGQHVVTGGPYRWIRHPGYAGGLLTYLATPVLLDSVWAFLPTVIITTLLIIRTSLEDRTLQDRLAGYHEYAERVRHRLVPGVW